ncbi:response regulator transcription factor [Nocardiopsis changdeensis]|uniref:Response regulator transcription factor n=2 Tax=Nocardiopsis TaxID=2013 RepID=A0ABX8BSW5_9ACTN|nr:response regulator transcription factor [Nocardiopsis changdeensis]QUX25179.1 response regulator transcription factor [Nocardiopsis changdeensis]QYX35566.1 response regulator transcription factor [Nocardiopsis sp. MT53]
MTGPGVRVLVAEDQAMLRGSLRFLIDHTPGMAAAGEAATGAEAVEEARRLLPDVVLMDIRMPVLDGIEATRRICADPRTSGVRVLVLTTFDLDEYVYAALHAGAAGFLLKDTPPAKMIEAVGVVASGESLLSPSVTRRLIAAFVRGPGAGRPSALPGSVTERETEVLRLVASGFSNSELAEHLHLSMATVKTHIGRLLAKLHARDRAQLVIAAYESGLVGAGRAERPRA